MAAVAVHDTDLHAFAPLRFVRDPLPVPGWGWETRAFAVERELLRRPAFQWKPPYVRRLRADEDKFPLIRCEMRHVDGPPLRLEQCPRGSVGRIDPPQLVARIVRSTVQNRRPIRTPAGPALDTRFVGHRNRPGAVGVHHPHLVSPARWPHDVGQALPSGIQFPGVDGVLGQSWLVRRDYLLDYRNHSPVVDGAAPEGGVRTAL